MSPVVAIPPVKPGDNTTPSVSPAASTAVPFHYTQTDSFVALLQQPCRRHDLHGQNAFPDSPRAIDKIPVLFLSWLIAVPPEGTGLPALSISETQP